MNTPACMQGRNEKEVAHCHYDYMHASLFLIIIKHGLTPSVHRHNMLLPQVYAFTFNLKHVREVVLKNCSLVTYINSYKSLFRPSGSLDWAVLIVPVNRVMGPGQKEKKMQKYFT